MINKLVANIKKTGAPIVVGAGSDVELYSKACTGQSFLRNTERL